MKRKLYALSLVALLFIYGCYPAGPEYVDELDIVYSNYDASTNFVAKGTYSMPDKIVKITGDVNAAPKYVKDIYALPMLAQIDLNMKNLGWTKVDVNSNPDVQLLPAAWETTTIVTGGYWGNYWCYYYYYYCGGGWYYPYPVVSSYTTGTMVMTMVDPNMESTDESKQVVWTSAINGLLQDTYNVTRVNNAIDQAFRQSPYLKTN